MRQGGGKAKGSQYERDFARQLSLWWTQGQDNAVFWRTASSGAMGTITGIAEQEGDIAAVKPAGVPLMRLFMFELKHYAEVDLYHLIKPTKSILWGWWEKLGEAAGRTKRYPFVVFKVNRKGVFGMLPLGFKYMLIDNDIPVILHRNSVIFDMDRFMDSPRIRDHFERITRDNTQGAV